MTDDVGFGASSTFGGPIPTPRFDQLAKAGLRYNRFHTTALCSPTRTALITGRNHHTNATGVIMEFATGYPGYHSVMPKSSGTVAHVLGGNGYSTSWFGKNHNVPDWQSSQAGPFDLWPTGLGFEHFYGFVGGDTDQWHSALFAGTKRVEDKRLLKFIRAFLNAGVMEKGWSARAWKELRKEVHFRHCSATSCSTNSTGSWSAGDFALFDTRTIVISMSAASGRVNG